MLPAQNKRMLFKGTVLDRETRQVIKGANITISGTRRGTTSDGSGDFSITIYNLPVYMNVSHVGYETQRIWLDNPFPSITILLNPATTSLPEVEIKAKHQPEPFFKDNQYSVLDYEVDSNRVYLLIYRFRLVNSELICKSVDGDTIARSGLLHFKPASLLHDCMGNIHVLSTDSVYQVKREGDHLIFFYHADLAKFRSVLSNCVASTENLLFFRKESPTRLSAEFYTVDRKNSRRQYLASVNDKARLKLLRDNPYDHFLLMLDTIPGDAGTAAEWAWVKKILYKPNSSSLYKIGDLMGIFNSTEYTLSLYTLNGEYTSKLKMPVEAVKDGKWTTEIYIDEMYRKAYTSFKKGEIFTIYRIDLNTGELKRTVSIEHSFPQKIRIHNNFLFYLYDLPAEGDNRHLFRQKL